MKNGGVGAAYSEALLENDFSGKYTHTGINREFVSHAGVSSLMKKYSLDCEGMVRIIENEAYNER
jgi:deoxyxylulose-5-phosphate synthase